jgi:hypothetical protein
MTPRTPGSRHHPAYDAMIPWNDATIPGIEATVPRNDAAVPQNQAFIPWGTPLDPWSGMKKITQVANNPGSHRPNPGSGQKNLGIRRSTPGSRPQSQSPAADPRVAAPAPEPHGAPQNSTPGWLVPQRTKRTKCLASSPLHLPIFLPPPLPIRVGGRNNACCLDDPPHPRLDPGRLFRCNRFIHKNPFFS